MTRLEKQSWYRLAVAVVTLLAVGIVYVLTHSPLRSMAGFAVMGLWGLTQVVGSSGPEPKIKKVEPGQKWSFVGSLVFVTLISFFVYWGTLNKLVIFIWVLLVAYFWWQKRRLFSPGLRMPRYDEREQAVNRKAARLGFVVFWILFVITNTLIAVLHPQPVPSYFLAGEVLIGAWVMIVGTSVATLWQERADG